VKQETALVPTDHRVISIEGGELEGCEVDGVWYVAMARACRRLQLDWSAQYRRILRDPILTKGMVIMAIPSAGGLQETACLRLDLFWGWLFKLELSRLEPEVAEQIMPIQLAGYQALYERFNGHAAQSPALEALAAQVAELATDVAKLKESVRTLRRRLNPPRTHVEPTRQESYSQFFLETLRGLLASGRALLIDLDAGRQELPATQTLLGGYDRAGTYLIAQAAYGAFRKHLRAAGRRVTFTQRALSQRFDREGLLQSTVPPTLMIRKRVDSRRCWCWHLPPGIFES
jgi:uncharacterized coiled-coil protein SlyX